jgi:hypothetical protein
MSAPASRDSAPSQRDGDGVRVVHEASRPHWLKVILGPIAVAAAIGAAWWISMPPPARDTGNGGGDASERVVATLPMPSGAERARPAPPRTARQRAASAEPLEATQGPDDLPSDDPNDLASHFAPGDPEPTAAEVIEALQASGDRTGLGAFNPPGTSPLLQGIAVPEDFVVPEGYVRHHQVTDEGEPLEPILMFSPDYVFRDANGNEIAIPDNRVVPPELAPPGLPLRPITLPKP